MAVKEIDFSAKHDRFIQNPDGTLSRMDEPYFTSKKIAENTWQIFSSGDYSYLVAGDEQAIAIDTGYGAGNIRDYMQSLTDKPLSCVINTHDHFDHTANNGYFDCAYMGEKTVPLATIPSPSFEGIDFPQDYERIAVGTGYVFSLGNRDLEVFDLPDHAVGSIVLLDRKERILFSGDEFVAGGKTLNGGVNAFYNHLKPLFYHCDEIDQLCGGPGIFDGKLLCQVYAGLEYILDGHEGEIPALQSEESEDPVSPDSKGRIVYHRQYAHPEDRHYDGEDGAKYYRREIVCAGVKINYDIRLKDD